MSYHTHHTEALVIKGFSVGEDNRFFSLFTRELGLLRALAKSVRLERSKLRYHLQEYAFVRVSLVRGRDIWRVTGAGDSHNPYRELAGEPHKQLIVLQITALLSRLLQGEEIDASLFDLVSSGFSFLREVPMDAETVHTFECMLVLRILARLGYVGDDTEIHPFLQGAELSHAVLMALRPRQGQARFAINQALHESGL
jgi:DNA repair protein RecO (recombination protein O)